MFKFSTKHNSNYIQWIITYQFKIKSIFYILIQFYLKSFRNKLKLSQVENVYGLYYYIFYYLLSMILFKNNEFYGFFDLDISNL